MALLGIDVGSTHCKSALFKENGEALAIASRPTRAHRTGSGHFYLDPEALWETVVAVVREVVARCESQRVRAIGIAGMAEAGLLVEVGTGRPRSNFIPWYDTAAASQVERIRQSGDLFELFCKFGNRPNLKSSLAKALWIREEQDFNPKLVHWMGAADWIAFRMTGVAATDYSLAGRTYAFDLEKKQWDASWLAKFGLPADFFPPARPSGTPLGYLINPRSMGENLGPDIPVAVSGHDHICGALAAGVLHPYQVFDSMGTAETMIGIYLSQQSNVPVLGTEAFQSGLAYGCYVVPNQYYWIGSLNASGGSIEWLRNILGDNNISGQEFEVLLDQVDPSPGSILYFPYLAGSGSPHSDPYVRGAFVGLDLAHQKQDLVKAVLEGVAYEAEVVRRAAEGILGTRITRLTAAGGGARQAAQMQIKANVSGAQYDVVGMTETTLAGAALLAGIGAGVYPDLEAAMTAAGAQIAKSYFPDEERHLAYQKIFENGYLCLQEPFRQYFRSKVVR